jgi:hypothetical protein
MSLTHVKRLNTLAKKLRYDSQFHAYSSSFVLPCPIVVSSASLSYMLGGLTNHRTDSKSDEAIMSLFV